MNDRLGLHSILGRLLLSAVMLISVVVAVAWWSHVKVSDVTTTNTLRLSERVSIGQEIRHSSNSLWKIENDFKAYMLVAEEKLRARILVETEALMTHASQLSQESWVHKTTEIKSAAEEFSQDSKRLHSHLDDIMTIRADPMKVFPSMPIMVNQMNPISSQFVGLINIALEDVSEIQNNDMQREITKHFHELRYAWLSKINTFRLLTASRVGISMHSIESSISDATYNISIHDQQIRNSVQALKSLEQRDLLGFEQSAALAELQRLNSDWNTNYQKVSNIINQEEGWRRDTPILQKTTNPLFNQMWTNIRSLETELEKRAVQDIHSTSAMADQISDTLWLLVVAIVFVTLVITLLFESQIRRPIVRVARALKAVAEGEEEISLPESPVIEARDLITAFSHMRKKVHSRQEHLQAVLTYAADAIITTSPEGIIESFNPAAEFLFSYKDIDIQGKCISILVPEFTELTIQSDGSEMNSYAVQSFGEQFPIGINISQMQVGGRDLLLVMIADIRERHAMLEGIQAREQRLRSILDNTAEGIVTFDEHWRIENWNLAAERLFGWQEKEVYGALFKQFIFSESDENLYEVMQIAALNELIGQENEVVGRHKNGSHYPLSLKISQMTLEGKVKYTALIANISERKAMMENLRYLAEHDSLTHLHNRAYFNDELTNIVTLATSGERDYALLYLDLDNFKYVNDTLGHAAGDRLLVEVATMLTRRARGSDIVARLGGDEFVILIADVNEDNIQAIAESYRNTLSEYGFHHEGRTVDVGCSIGVSIINQSSTTPSETLSQADVACHLAKKAGRNRVHLFSNKDANDVHTMSIDMGWSRRIRQALEKDRFVLAVQPIFNIQTRSIESYEVLLRMLDDDDSIIMPYGFLPTADRFGLSADIDAWVIEHAIKHMAFLNDKGISIRYAINLSGQAMTAPHIAELIPQLIAETGIDPAALTFEVTETTAISDVDLAITLLTKLRNLGCKTALDDFGSGMSSFAYLQELPVDIVKIDGRFVRNITSSSVDQAMVRAMNEIAHALDKVTVAEFVENEHHLKTLSIIGVDFGQGYHLGKPVLIDDMTAALLQQSNPRIESA